MLFHVSGLAEALRCRVPTITVSSSEKVELVLYVHKLSLRSSSTSTMQRITVHKTSELAPSDLVK
jgi:hypothetical protein